MQIGNIKPKDDPSSSTQVEPPTSSTNQIQIDEDDNKEDDQPSNLPPRIHNAIAKDHPIDQILGDVSKGIQTRSHIASFCEHYSFVSSIEPKHVEEALDDSDWVNAMHEQLNNFTQNEV